MEYKYLIGIIVLIILIWLRRNFSISENMCLCSGAQRTMIFSDKQERQARVKACDVPKHMIGVV